ncbi:delta 9-fatty acid desaturase protein [Phanerochaete sordida]|uniref:Acyl-CoA desaturase n=1 Tax=Phanerochaete sordida TaxID=48140 RepID=A0A9P3L7S6_9APHY|nr:delta 9-fatty acid desaturase protein [Phanerochaete sordida]
MTISCGGWLDSWIPIHYHRSHHAFSQRQAGASASVRDNAQQSNYTNDVLWFNVFVVITTPLVSIYGLCSTPFSPRMAAFCVLYYLLNMIGITAGYHRLWSHRSYNAHPLLQLFYAIAGAGAIQGSILWWSRHHRSHHRYTDTDLDPYGAHRGLWWSHIGWMLTKPRIRPGAADTSDLKQNRVVMWQHRWFFALALAFGLVAPTVIPGLLWDDWWGGFFFAGFLRLTLVHHSVFSVNSLAHWLGSTTYDDKLSPRDHFLTALVTLGEGYHNFHHQFPVDYRNAVKWYQWDPTKWFIAACARLGLASHLRKFPEMELRKSELTMKLKTLKREQDTLQPPVESAKLPVVDWETYQQKAQEQPLVLVAGFIHDVEPFLDEHPGGRRLLETHVGRDATTAFFGGVYDHSNAAHNLLATMRVGALHGGLEQVSEQAIPPWQRLQIVSALDERARHD